VTGNPVTNVVHSHSPGQDVTSIVATNSGEDMIAGFALGWTKNGNKTHQRDLLAPARSQAYGVDTLNRLTSYREGTPDSAAVDAPVVVSDANLQREWKLAEDRPFTAGDLQWAEMLIDAKFHVWSRAQMEAAHGPFGGVPWHGRRRSRCR
jgi:hypothetical protein